MKVQVNLGERSYPILILADQLNRLGSYLAPLGLNRRILVVTNVVVGGLYGERVTQALKDAGFEVVYRELPDGEIYKSLDSAEKLYTQALQAGIERGSAVVALGGGVIGDLAGFVAATYMRGLPLIQVPTTLLAQTDSSVGGKVAVNHPLGKNIIGSFYQPSLVFTEVTTLRTLPEREIRAGLGEVIKYGVIQDEEFFEFLENNLEGILHLDPETLLRVVERACTIKAHIVEQDEKETGLRAVLNFGHTIGHALEVLTRYRVYRHGEAVAAGMVAAATIAAEQGLCSQDLVKRLTSLLERAGLPTRIPFEPESILEVLPRDKKTRDGRPRFVLPLALGRVTITPEVNREVLRSALTRCRATD